MSATHPNAARSGHIAVTGLLGRLKPTMHIDTFRRVGALAAAPQGL